MRIRIPKTYIGIHGICPFNYCAFFPLPLFFDAFFLNGGSSAAEVSSILEDSYNIEPLPSPGLPCLHSPSFLAAEGAHVGNYTLDVPNKICFRQLLCILSPPLVFL